MDHFTAGNMISHIAGSDGICALSTNNYGHVQHTLKSFNESIRSRDCTSCFLTTLDTGAVSVEERTTCLRVMEINYKS